MKQIFIYIIFFVSSFCSVLSQVLPPQRAVNWKSASCKFSNEGFSEFNIMDFGADNTGLTSNDEALSSAIESAMDSAVIYFPPGKYLFSSPVSLKSNFTLRGAAADQTELIFDLVKKTHLIMIHGRRVKLNRSISEPLLKGNETIRIENTDDFSTNDLFLIVPFDQDLITSEWAKGTSGQICKITGILNTGLGLESEIRRNYSETDLPVIDKIEPIHNVGIESLKITRKDPTDNQTSNISIQYAENCRVNCIESENCNFAHIDIRTGIDIEIRGSFFHDAFAYGGGGQGYGVVFQSTSGECLIYNNIFKHLRHAVIGQSGANGNVIAYNYSIETYWTEVSLPSDAAGDLVLHGNYTYANLFEGNICQNIVIDDSHGQNGPYNTFFRNRTELYGIFMNFSPATDKQNFIGNEILEAGFMKGLYFLNGEDHFEYGNNNKGEIVPDPNVDLTDISYYFSKSPEKYYTESSSWPTIGIPNESDEYQNEAKMRYKSGQYTKCSELTSVSSTSSENLKIYPTPTTGKLNIDSDKTILSLMLYNNFGEQLLRHTLSRNIDLSNYPTGIYYLYITFSDGNTVFEKIIKN